MACRRSDRARFIGCHVGAARIRGCERGCCPYGESPADIERNERLNYLNLATSWNEDKYKPDNKQTAYCPPHQANNGLHACLNPYRPKYVCTACRRVFKPAILDRNEYDISQWGWWISPKRGEIPEIWRAWITLVERKKSPESRTEVNRLMELESNLMERYRKGDIITKQERAALRTLANPNPELWSEPLRTSCPGCSRAGTPVGGTFRAPRQDDRKGWERVERLLQDGERFTYCLYGEKEVEVLRAGIAENDRRKGAKAWAEEKRKRIKKLTGKIV